MFTDRPTKADILVKLKPLLKKALIESIHVFTVKEWQRYPDRIVGLIQDRFSPRMVVIRSSCINEDTATGSKAGCFHSELGVDSSRPEAISAAVKNVINSYKDKDILQTKSQVIVQTQADSVMVSGVVFTRALGTNSPYYIINYDDNSGKTTTVTGGMVGDMVCIFRSAKVSRNNRWFALLQAAKEIERHFPGQPLDIEFAIKKNNTVLIFQVRPLAANKEIGIPDETHIKELIENMKAKYKRFSRRVPHLAGERTIFGDMPDWNPAEMIGNRPNTLDYSLYSFLITDSVWHEARSSLGYKDVYPGELMASFGKRPYIDVRLSFNSFIPADLPYGLTEKLVIYYLDKLEKNPEKQDKVEFEIVWSCYNFSLDRQLKELRSHGFSQKEIKDLAISLKGLTNRILGNAERLFGRDINMIAHLTERKEQILSARDPKDDSPWTVFNLAYNLLQNCKKFGIFPFSRLARLAFIGKSILISLREEGIIKESSYDNFLNSIQTVASMFNEDLAKLQSGDNSKEQFLRAYGHLRPGTYDITAPRYDMIKGLFRQDNSKKRERDKIKRQTAAEHSLLKDIDSASTISKNERLAIYNQIRSNGLYGDSASLLDFISKAIRYRELAKLEFTRTLSDVLEFIAIAGERLGFSREDLSQVDLTTLMKFRNPEYSDADYARKVIGQSCNRHKQEKEWSDLLILPPVIISERDFEMVSFYKARPNFITKKIVRGPVLAFEREKFLKMKSMTGFIVLLENADPGFDWIFSKRPSGIVTKYGGVASHMAIRCAEFGIPAAIGCGVTIYDNLLKSRIVTIDCAKQVLVQLEV